VAHSSRLVHLLFSSTIAFACGDDGRVDTGANTGTDATTSGDADTGDGDGDPDPSGDGDGESSGDGDGEPALGCSLVWESGFENGFPGEWDTYDSGSWSPDGSMPLDRVSAWTIVDAGVEPVFSGDHGYKGWIWGPSNDSHRAYPGISLMAATPIVNTFMVRLDVDYDLLGGEWIHFGTWGNFLAEDQSGLYALHTMSVRERKLEFAHTEPFLGEWIGPEPAPDFPTGQWVRFTVYAHYEGDTGFVQAWQDGVPVLRATVAQLATNPGTWLSYAHWGMYAGATASTGVQYNDDIRIWRLDAPLDDLEAEPDCFLGD
jgi:hypothetical protein